VWLIDFGLSAPAGQQFADFFKGAGKKLGWKVTVYDGKFSPDEYLAGIRQAIAAKADGIVLYIIDCVLVQAALQDAERAGIPVSAAESTDCSEAKPGAPSLFDAGVTYTQGDFTTYMRALGASQADYLITKTNGKSKAIVLLETDLQITVNVYEGFLEEMRQCTQCKMVETVEFTAPDAGPKLQQKTEQALLKHPEANAVVTPIDDFVTAGVAAAIMASGRNAKILSVAGGGLPANMDLIRADRGEDGGYGISIGWESYSAMDNLNRLFNKQKPESSGIGVQVIDREHNVPPSGIYQPPIDFQAIYEKIWAEGKG
jgi:ribose transport system substrate-binding protein